MPSVEAPGRSRPMTRSHADTDWRSRAIPAVDERLLVNRDPEIGRIAPSVSPKNPGGATPTIVNGWPSTTKVAPTTDVSPPYVRLPGVMAHDRDRRRADGWSSLVDKDAAAERADTERREIVAGHVLGAQRPCRLVRRPHVARSGAHPPAWNAATCSNSGVSAFSRSIERIRKTCPSGPAARLRRSSRRRRRSGRGAPGPRPAATAASRHE